MIALSSVTELFSKFGHRYNLGQLRLAGNKLHPYDNDLKIPMTIRGPGIAEGTVFDHVVSYRKHFSPVIVADFSDAVAN